MGILGLGSLIHERAPGGIKEGNIKNYFGRKVAIDASMSIYQFVIAMQGFEHGESIELQNAAGEVTTHLAGLFSRTLRLIDEGVKPVYVFDGKAPEMKKQELDKRRDRANAARAAMETAKEQGDDEAMAQQAKRSVRLTREQMGECKKLLELMGLPVVQAASEAEAQCCELVRGNRCWAVATEDMDALVHGAPILLRHLGAGDPKKRPVQEYRVEAILQQLGFTREMFIDLCILMGCDYCPKIPGIGPVKAFELIQTHKSIEAAIESLDKAKYPVPSTFLYKEARELFVKPDVTPAAEIDLSFKEPDEKGLMQYMVDEKMFDPARIERGIARLKAALTKKTQVRLDSFFTVKAAPLQVHQSNVNNGGKRGRAASAHNKDGGGAGGGAAAAPGKPANTANRGAGHKKAVVK